MRRFCALSIVLAFAAFQSHAHAADRTGITPTSIKIGLFGPITSSNGVFAKVVYGAAAMYKDINDHGGIDGRKIDLVIEDDACDGPKTLGVVKKFIEKDKVFMLHGGWCSAAVLVAKPEIVSHPNIAYMNLASASPAISSPVTRNIFQPAPTSKTIADTIVDFALTKPGAKSIALVTQPDEGPNSKIRAAAEKLKKLGITPVDSIVLQKGAADASGQAKELQSKSPDVILVSLYPQELATLLRDIYKIGLQTTVVATESASLEDTDKRLGIRDAMKDVYFFYPFTDTLTSPRLSKYAKIIQKYYPDQILDMSSFQGVTGALVVIEALRKSGPGITRERFLEHLEALKGFNPGIQPTPVEFSKESHSGAKSGNMITLAGRKITVVSKYPQTKTKH